MGITTVNGLVEFLEVDALSDLESEFPFKDEVLPTVLLLSAIIRHARNDLNTRAYHRSGCCYYRGIMFEYHVELLQACFAISGLPFDGINAKNARREAEALLGLDSGYLEPQYTRNLGAPGAAAAAAIDLYRIAAENKKIAESVLQKYMPALLDEAAHRLPSDEEIEWLERHFERRKFGTNAADNEIAQETASLYDPLAEHCKPESQLMQAPIEPKEPIDYRPQWIGFLAPENQMELGIH
ncbi:MAG: hypothetical protein IBX50_15870 [Marinospirillum sp.]|uniref:hypothetical protein n=1 Tax=Marinospirillum sp. TaxID=2183934 RepID=UPI0019DFCD62|nr:hypothetical protein [Marinospirillum sp.]MBE0508167.1 hypothetical protein [Marinospirillum sp.]